MYYDENGRMVNLVLRYFMALVCLIAVSTAGAQDALEARVTELESRVAQLEAMLTNPAPPATTQEVDGFTFQRVNLRRTGIGLEVLGEVKSDRNYESVRFRFTLYDESGNILETHSFSVQGVGPAPRTFNSGIFTDYRPEDVAVLAWQLEGTR
jgi:hypothetical protein